MRVQDNYDRWELNEWRRKRGRDEEDPEPNEYEEDEVIEVAFYITDRREDIENIQDYLDKHDYNYEREDI